MNIGWPRFKILGGGGGGGGQGGQLFAGCKLIGAPAPNQCQIITFFTLKTNYITKLRIELKSILLEITSNKIKGILLSLLPLSLFSAILTVCVGRGGGGSEGGGQIL